MDTKLLLSFLIQNSNAMNVYIGTNIMLSVSSEKKPVLHPVELDL